MIDDSAGQAPTSPDIAKRQKALKIKIFDWKKKGYSVSKFQNLVQQDILVAEREFEGFLRLVQNLVKLEEKLYRLDTEGFEEQVKRIEDRIKDPGSIEDLQREIILLEEGIVKRKITESGSEGNEQAAASLKRELEKIREEELHRIRTEEADILREQERKKILEEELQRIREEERERLKISELGRIRKEEKERLVWEDRVVRQLKHAKEQEAERATKKMKCPSCKGSIPITSDERPLKVRCPGCGKDYTLKAKKNEGEKKEQGSKIQYKKCSKCSSPIPIISDKRPLKIICQMCNSEFMLKGKKSDGPLTGPGLPDALANPTLPLRDQKSPGLQTNDYGSHDFKSGIESITCPTCNRDIPGEAQVCGYCGAPIDPAEIAGKNEIPCAQCGQSIPSDAKICGYCGTPVTFGGPQGPMDDFELPLSPNEKILDDFSDKKVFKPLNDYSIPMNPDLAGPGPAPPGSMEKYTGPPDGITCPKCGNVVPRGAKFCGVCGNTM